MVTKDLLDRYLAWEQSVVDWSNHWHRYSAVRHLFAGVSRLGDGIGWYAIMVIMLAAHGWTELPAVLHMLVVSGLGLMLYAGIKKVTARPRPCDARNHLHVSVAPLDKYSFPSGHTLHAVSFAILMLHYWPELAALVIPFALLVAVSRLVLGLHYLSDVLAGAAIGATLALLSLPIVA